MGLHCNWQKTKVQNVRAGPAPPPVQMENQLVESVTKFTYLGSDVVSSSSSTPEVHRRIGLANYILGQLDGVWNRRLFMKQESEYETETLHVPYSIRLAAWIWDVDSDQSRLGPTAGFSHEGRKMHPEHKVIWLRHQWFRSEPDKADRSTSHQSWQKTLIARTCLPPTTRCASPQHPPALCHPLTGQMPCPRLEASTWPAKEDLDTTGRRG